jgi:4-carboxymuconolactone decarboxylase
VTAPPPRLPDLDLGALDPVRRALADQVMAGRGRLPTPFRVWLASPELARCLHPLGLFLAHGSSLTKAETEIAVLAAARHWLAGYVLETHTREARAAGVGEDVLAALREGAPALPASPRQRAVAAMMASLTRPGTPGQQVFDTAVAQLGHEGVAEVLAVAGYFSAVGLAMKFYAVPVPAGG